MLTLTREVRFSVPFEPDGARAGRVENSYAGWPTMNGPAMWLRLEVTLTGELDRDSQYLVDIQKIDRVVREQLLPALSPAAIDSGPAMMHAICRTLSDHLNTERARLLKIVLHLSPFHSWAVRCDGLEESMVRVSQSFEFSAAHRLHNPALSDEANRQLFGKCNNALGHGHNYKVQVTVRETPDRIISLPEMERIVNESVIKPFDHKHLNLEVPDFKETLASVENIAAAAFRRLRGTLPGVISVTVWETEKTWAEYSE